MQNTTSGGLAIPAAAENHRELGRFAREQRHQAPDLFGQRIGYRKGSTPAGNLRLNGSRQGIACLRRDNGRIVIPAIYESINILSETLFEAQLHDGSNWILIDTDGNIINND